MTPKQQGTLQLEFNKAPKISTKVVKTKWLTLYFPVDRDNIYEYFSMGMFLSELYFKQERTYNDIQSYHKGHLLLSTKPIKMDGTKYCNIALQINETELKDNSIYLNQFYFLTFPLPISRVIKIIVEFEEDKSEILTKGKNESTGPIPENLFEISNNQELIDITEVNKISEPLNPDLRYDHECQLYDRMLGTLAIMRNAGYFFPSGGTISTISNEYITAIDTLLNFEVHKSENDYFLPLFSCDANNPTILKHFFEYFRSNTEITKDNFQRFITAQENVSESDKIILINALDILETGLYEKKLNDLIFENKVYKSLIKCFVYLFKYQDIDAFEAFVALLDEKFKSKEGTACLMLLGWFHGYAKLRPFIKLESINMNNLYIGAIELRQPVKFALLDELERDIVSQIYYTAFRKFVISKPSYTYSIKNRLNYSEEDILNLRYQMMLVWTFH